MLDQPTQSIVGLRLALLPSDRGTLVVRRVLGCGSAGLQARSESLLGQEF